MQRLRCCIGGLQVGMIDQVLTDTLQVEHDRYANTPKVRCRPDSRMQQDTRRPDRAAGDDYLAPCPRLPHPLPCLQVTHADRATALDQYAKHMRPGSDQEV